MYIICVKISFIWSCASGPEAFLFGALRKPTLAKLYLKSYKLKNFSGVDIYTATSITSIKQLHQRIPKDKEGSNLILVLSFSQGF